MTGNRAYEAALGIQKPWSIASTAFSMNEESGRMEMHIHVDFLPGSEFPCPVCGNNRKSYDTHEKVWRHLNFFQYRCYIHARVPRIECAEHGIKTVSVPWGREGSGFTVMMEGVILAKIQHIPVKTVASQIGEQDTKLWRMLDHCVEEAKLRRDFSDVKSIGIDEYSHKGHDYITVILSHKTDKHSRPGVLDIEDGKGDDTVDLFSDGFSKYHGKSEAIENVTSDMIHGFRNAMKLKFPESTVTVDKFHVVKMIGDAVDSVRRREMNSGDRSKTKALSKTRCLWLKNRSSLKDYQQSQLDELLNVGNLDTVIAYNYRLRLQSIYEDSQSCEDACYFFENLVLDIQNSPVREMAKVGKSLGANAEEILNYFDTRKTNAILEGFNSKISIIKNRARGFRNKLNFKNMIYFCLGDLSFPKATIMP